MSTGGDISEQLVRDGMVVMEELAKVAGHLTKEAIALLAALIKREGQAKGAMPVTKLKNEALKTGQTLEIFQLKKSDISVFKKLSKEYGVLYHKPLFPPVFLSRDKDTMVDMVALSGDVRAIDHIYEKLGYPVPERDDGKNADTRAASEQSSNERGSGYEKSKPNRESDAPARAGSEAQGGKSAIADIQRFKEQAKALKNNRGTSVSKTQAGPVR